MCLRAFLFWKTRRISVAFPAGLGYTGFRTYKGGEEMPQEAVRLTRMTSAGG